jgi:hypothetical protein
VAAYALRPANEAADVVALREPAEANERQAIAA